MTDSTKMVTCSICKEKGSQHEAIVWCPNCGDQLCQSCLDHHKIARASRDHNTVPIESFIKLLKYASDLKLNCEEHNANYTHFCTKHDQAICMQCLLPEHRNCDRLLTIEEAVKNVKSSVTFEQLETKVDETLENTEKSSKEVSRAIASFMDNESNIDTQIREKRSEINTYFDFLETRTRRCLSAIRKTHVPRIEAHKANLQLQETTLKQFKETIRNVKEHGNDLQVFLLIKEMEKKVTEHVSHVVDLLSQNALDMVNLELQFHNNLVDLEKSFPDMGKIIISPAPTSLRLHWTDIKSAQRKVQPIQKQQMETIHRAVFDYEATGCDELAITAGDILLQLPKDEIWYVGEMDSKEKDRMFEIEDNDIGSYVVSQNWKTNKNSGLIHCLTNPCLRFVENWEIKDTCLDQLEKLPGESIRPYQNFSGKWNKSVPVRIQSFKKNDDRHFYNAEKRILSQCHHSNIVKFYGFTSTIENIYVVTELARYGALDTILKMEKRTFPELLHFAVHVACGLEYLESKKIVYSDVFIGNVWVFDNDVAKLSGFFLAKEEINIKPVMDGKLTVNERRAAPEILESGKESIKADVWAFGVFLIELTSDTNKIYQGMSNEDVSEKVKIGYKHPKPSTCPAELYQLILKCLNTEPDNRPTFEFLHSFLSDYHVAIEDNYDGI